jgi:hypothetical protein
VPKETPCAAASRLYREALRAQPDLVASPVNGLHYDAACAAALAGVGAGEDTDQLTDGEHAVLREQALDWLRADLAAWGRLMESESALSRQAVAATLRHWLEDRDFKGVRGPDALGKLSRTEREGWRRLWADVADTLGRSRRITASTKTTTAK